MGKMTDDDKRSVYQVSGNKNPLPMIRYQPYTLKYQLVIDVVERFVLGDPEKSNMYFGWKVERINDDTNLVTQLESHDSKDTKGDASDLQSLIAKVELELFKNQLLDLVENQLEENDDER